MRASASMVIAVYAARPARARPAARFPRHRRRASKCVPSSPIPALLARAIVWMATEPRCANQSFNVVNGDYPRWADLWPRHCGRFRHAGRRAAQREARDVYGRQRRGVGQPRAKTRPARRRGSPASRCGRTAIICCGRSGRSTRRWRRRAALGFSETLDTGSDVRAALRALPRGENHSLGFTSLFGTTTLSGNWTDWPRSNFSSLAIRPVTNQTMITLHTIARNDQRARLRGAFWRPLRH